MVEQFFDAHTHLNLQFADDWREVGRRALEAGARFVNVGTDQASSKRALEQAEFLGDGVWATAGLHPHDSNQTSVIADDLAEVKELASSDRVVAIGECGLDYFKLPENSLRAKQRQRELFVAQIELALSLNKPLMIHCRSNESGDAHADLEGILAEHKRRVGDRLKFNLHFFTGDWVTAKRFLDLDGYFSFPGVITFSTAADETIKNLSLDRMMSETDAPFASPAPFRGRRNEPAYVRLVAEHLAKLRSESRETVLTALVANAEKFFGLPQG